MTIICTYSISLLLPLKDLDNREVLWQLLRTVEFAFHSIRQSMVINCEM